MTSYPHASPCHVRASRQLYMYPAASSATAACSFLFAVGIPAIARWLGCLPQSEPVYWLNERLIPTVVVLAASRRELRDALSRGGPEPSCAAPCAVPRHDASGSAGLGGSAVEEGNRDECFGRGGGCCTDAVGRAAAVAWPCRCRLRAEAGPHSSQSQSFSSLRLDSSGHGSNIVQALTWSIFSGSVFAAMLIIRPSTNYSSMVLFYKGYM